MRVQGMLTSKTKLHVQCCQLHSQLLFVVMMMPCETWFQQQLMHLQVSTFYRRATSLQVFCSMPCFFWERSHSLWFLVLCLMTLVLKSRYSDAHPCVISWFVFNPSL